jgi:hypothetical protein
MIEFCNSESRFLSSGSLLKSSIEKYEISPSLKQTNLITPKTIENIFSPLFHHFEVENEILYATNQQNRKKEQKREDKEDEEELEEVLKSLEF